MTKPQRIRLSSLCFATLIIIGSQLVAPGADNEAQQSGWLSKIGSHDKLELGVAVQQAGEERQHSIDALRPVLEQPVTETNRSQIAAAMRIAGSMRLSETVGSVIDKIDFLEFGTLPTSRPISVVDDPRDYLAIQTLVQIGNTAVVPVLRRLAAEPDSQRQLYLAVVLKDVLGADCADLLVRNELKKAVAANSATKGLENAAKIFSEMQ